MERSTSYELCTARKTIGPSRPTSTGMATQGRFRDLMRQVNEGSDDAIRELVQVYGPHILRVVRMRLSKHLRSKFDSADFVQSVWAAFFAIPASEVHFDRA